MLVAVLAMSGGAIFEAIAKHVGLGGSRGDLLDVYTAATTPASGRRMSSLAGVVHRLERGVRLV